MHIKFHIVEVLHFSFAVQSNEVSQRLQSVLRQCSCGQSQSLTKERKLTVWMPWPEQSGAWPQLICYVSSLNNLMRSYISKGSNQSGGDSLLERSLHLWNPCLLPYGQHWHLAAWYAARKDTLGPQLMLLTGSLQGQPIQMRRQGTLREALLSICKTHSFWVASFKDDQALAWKSEPGKQGDLQCRQILHHKGAKIFEMDCCLLVLRSRMRTLCTGKDLLLLPPAGRWSGQLQWCEWLEKARRCWSSTAILRILIWRRNCPHDFLYP